MLLLARTRIRPKPGPARHLLELRPLAEPGAAGKVRQRHTFPVLNELAQILSRALTGARLLPILKVQQDEVVLLNRSRIQEGWVFDRDNFEALILAQRVRQHGRCLPPYVTGIVHASHQQDARFVS